MASSGSDFSSSTSPLVQDTELNANVTSTYTEHFFDRRGRSGGPREVWARQSQLGRGSFGIVWLEKCKQLYRAGTPPLRAVKEIRIQQHGSRGPDYNRELEAFAKFSQPKVGRQRIPSQHCILGSPGRRTLG